MLPTPFAALPSSMQSERLRPYHDALVKRRTQLLFKRAFDVAVSGAALTLGMPLLLVLAAAVAADSPGGAIFCQKRRTKDAKPFLLLKFRTMTAGADRAGCLTTQNDARVTRVGRFLRDSRLDELPQLVNVLRGEMSLVGPRPEVDRFVARYDAEMRATLLLPAGITSRAALAFCDEARLLGGGQGERVYAELLLPRKAAINLDYVKNYNFLEDIDILMQTLRLW